MALAPLCPMITSPFASGKSFIDMPFPPAQTRRLLSVQRQQGCVEHHAGFSFPPKGSECGSPFLLRVQPRRQRTAAFQSAFARMQQQGQTKSTATTSETQTQSAPLSLVSTFSPLRASRPQQRVDVSPKKPMRFNRLTNSPKGSDKSTILRSMSSGRLMARSPSRSNINRRTKSGSGLLRC